MSGSNRIKIPSLFGTFALTWCHAASAEEAAGSTAKDPSVLEVIIVTAQKRSEDIQTVPISMTSIGRDELERLHANDLTAFAGYVPGLQINNSGGTPAQGALSLRGIPPLGSGATVATYLDESPLGSSSNYGGAAGTVLDLLPFDIQSFEVLRGPQGTLYGASSLGGLIKYVTRQPDLSHFSGLVGGDTFAMDSAGKAGYGGHASVNLPLIADTLGMIASFARENTPGVIDNAATGAKDQNDHSQQVARLALLWKPNEAISLSLSGIQQKIKSENNLITALDAKTLQPIYGRLKVDNVVAEPFAQDLDYVSATLNIDLGWADFVSATSYSSTRTDNELDATQVYGVLFPAFGFPAGKSALFSADQLRKTTEEVRLASKPGETIEWLIGGFYTHENSQVNQLATAQADDGTVIAGLNPLATEGLPSIYREYAVFGDVTYKFNSQFDLSGGLRWAHNSQDFTQISGGQIVPTSSTPGNSSQAVVTYSAGPRWHINSDTMAYFRLSSGYQPGGPNLSVPGVPSSVNADKLTNYELGLKTLLDDRKLLIDAAVYYISWKDIQILGTNGVVNYLVNGGTASSKGLELSTLYTPVEGLRLGLNGAYTDAELTEDAPGIGGLSGDRLPYAPKWSGAATADYAFLRRADWTARLGGGLRYTASRLTKVQHDPQSLPLNSYGVLDLNAELANERWTVRLFARNVTNKSAYIAYTPLVNAGTQAITEVHGIPLEPRVVGMGLDVRF